MEEYKRMKIKAYPLEEINGIYTIRVKLPKFNNNMQIRWVPFRDGDNIFADIFIETITIKKDTIETPKGDLVSNCCASDFNPFGYEKEEGIYQERCLNCGKLCEPLYISQKDIENIHRCLEWNS